MLSKRSKSNWMNWHHKFHNQFLDDKKFIPNGSNLLVAVSGGQDSMVLMTLINEIRSQHNWNLNIWHGNHQWHEESNKFANQLKEHCSKKEIPFYLDTAKIGEITSEEKARDWRYEKLCKKVDELLVKKQSINNWYILTGHTSSDTTETFLLNLARGSNYTGLSGIQKKRLFKNKYKLRRPILIFSREDTESICKIMKIPFCQDPTNQDLSIKRNLIRHKVLPHLEKIFPGYTHRINQFVEKMNHHSKEQSDLGKLALEACKNTTGIKRSVFNNLGIEAKSTIMNIFIKEKCIRQINSKNIEKLSIEISNKNYGQIKLPDGFKIIWNKDTIRLEN